MKSLLAVFSALCFFAFISCTKTNNVTTTIHDTTTVIHKDTTVVRDTVYAKHLNPIVGLWVGKYLNTGEVDSMYYSIDVRSNGNCIATSIGGTGNSAATSGPWQLDGTAFTANVTELTLSPVVKQTITAAYDSTAGTLNGQWVVTQGQATTKNGAFKLIRVQ
jgi:hypothetical protein